MFGYQKRIFVSIGLQVINAHILQKYFGGHLGLYIFHQLDSFGLYYVVLYNICVYSEQKCACYEFIECLPYNPPNCPLYNDPC